MHKTLAVAAALLVMPYSPSYCLAANDSSTSTFGLGPANKWVGAQVGLRFAGKGEFSDRVGGSAQFNLQEWRFGKMNLPLLTNISRIATPDAVVESLAVLNNIVQSSEGIHLRLVPNIWVSGEPASGGVNAWGSMGWHLTAVQDSLGKTEDMNEFRLGVGVEGSTMRSTFKSKYPTTLSLEYVFHLADRSAIRTALGRDFPRFESLEATAIIPIRDTDVGLMLEGIFSNEHVVDVWRAALVIAGARTSK